MGTVAVNLFGAPVLRRGDRPVRVDTRKAIALLAILAVENRPVRRDVIAALLWPEAGQERARASLRRTLSALRSAIGADAIAADRETIALDLPAGAVDVLDYDEKVAVAPEDALALYRGPFLEGFSVGDAPDFEDWHRQVASKFEATVDSLLERLGDDSDAATRVELSRRRLALDPLNEAACRDLMTALGSQGDRGAAIAAYRDLVRRLDEDLGVEPLAETTAVCDAVRTGRTLAPDPVAPSPERPARESPLVGRGADLDLVDAACEAGRFVVIVGEPGVGRTRVIEEWVAARTNALLVRCHPGEINLPYGPFSRWLEPTAGMSQIQLFDQLASSLPVESGDIIAIDDLHRADQATTAFLTYLVHRPDRFGLRVVGTWQAERLGAGDACWNLLAEGRREGWAAEVHLDRLGPDAMESVARDHGLSSPDEVRGVVEFADGLPLLAVERARAGIGADDIPQVVDDLMRTRLGRLSPVARQVLEALAIVDRPTQEDVVGAVAGRSMAETAAAFDELLRHGVVRSDGRAELTHHLLGTVGLRDLSSSRRRALHERAGEVLPPAEAAEHLAEAGHLELAADAHRTAARDAERAHALDAALHHLRAAAALGADGPEIRRRIGDLETATGRYDAARRAYEICAARSQGTDLARVELQLARLALRMRDVSLAASHLDSAEAELAASTDGNASSLGVELAVARALSTPAGSDDRRAVPRSIELAEELGDAAVEATAHGAAAFVAYQRAGWSEAITRADDAIRLARLGAAPLTEAAALNLRGVVASTRGDHESALESLERARAILDRHGDVHRLAAVHANLADAFHGAGRDDDARDHQLESARLFSEVSGDPLDGRAEIWFLTAW